METMKFKDSMDSMEFKGIHFHLSRPKICDFYGIPCFNCLFFWTRSDNRTKSTTLAPHGGRWGAATDFHKCRKVEWNQWTSIWLHTWALVADSPSHPSVFTSAVLPPFNLYKFRMAIRWVSGEPRGFEAQIAHRLTKWIDWASGSLLQNYLRFLKSFMDF